jgi:hypothetical protein
MTVFSDTAPFSLAEIDKCSKQFLEFDFCCTDCTHGISGMRKCSVFIKSVPLENYLVINSYVLPKEQAQTLENRLANAS